MAKNILFISHDATRTGAPILLLNLAEALKAKQNSCKISFLIKKAPYELLEKFKDNYATILAQKEYKFPYLVNKLVNRYIQSPYSEKKIKKALKDIDFVISNTITNGDILPLVRKYFSGPILSYIHELEMASKNFTDLQNIQNLIAYSDHFLVPSFAVKNFLQQVYQINENKIDLLDYYIPKIFQINGAYNLTQSNSSKAFIVGGAGTTDWRKGPEAFIQTAISVFRKEPEADIRFIWKGAPKSGIIIDRLLYDISKVGLQDRIYFEAASDEMYSFYKALNIFLLTSREDPYPLVVLEAASASIPTICFSESGGAKEFIEKSNGGQSVRYLDVEAMADAILFYYKNQEKAEFDGDLAKKQLLKTHQDSLYIVRQFELILDKIINK